MTMHLCQTEAQIQKLVAGIDEMVADQLCAIIQHPHFKQLEALWRGLLYTLDVAPLLSMVRIRVLDMNWREVSDDLTLSNRLQSSVLYRLINQQELNTLGGEPFGLLLIDRAVTNEPDEVNGHDDLYTLQRLGQLGQESLCPVVLALARDFVGTEDVEVWSNPERVLRILHSQDFSGWQRLRRMGSSRFLGLTLPEILLRTPWRQCYTSLRFDEYAQYGMGSDYLWGNSAFAFAGNVIQEFIRIRWFGFLRVPGERGGAVVRQRDSVPAAARLRLTDSLETFYSEQGFIPLATCYLGHELACFSNQSVHKPANDSDDARIVGMLQTTLIGCRFGHYLKVLIREHIGSYRDAQACQRDLNEWLQTYTSNVDYGDDSVLSGYPLKSSKVRVRGDESPGVFHCEVELQPQYQFDVINTSILLKTDASELAEIGR